MVPIHLQGFTGRVYLRMFIPHVIIDPASGCGYGIEDIDAECGVGKTGYFFAFEQAGVVPDIVTLAKSLGGGKAAIGAMISSKTLYLKAYGTPATALIHGTATFGGIGETCCTAIETLNLLYEEGLISNAAVQGQRLIQQLQGLQSKYPSLIPITPKTFSGTRRGEWAIFGP